MSKKPYPSETADRFIVRLPEGMRDRIRDSADANGRSMNAEIIRRLEVTFDMEEAEKTLPYRFSELDEKIDKLDRLLALTLDTISSPKSEADIAFAVEEFERRMRDNLAAHKKIVKRQRKT